MPSALSFFSPIKKNCLLNVQIYQKRMAAYMFFSKYLIFCFEIPPPQYLTKKQQRTSDKARCCSFFIHITLAFF